MYMLWAVEPMWPTMSAILQPAALLGAFRWESVRGFANSSVTVLSVRNAAWRFFRSGVGRRLAMSNLLS